MIYQRSSALFAEARKYIPGGVNSPVRAFKAVGGDPIFVEKAKGAYLYDADGNKLIDYIASWGPLILGHAYEPVINAVIEKAKKGTSFGMPTEIETELAKLAVSMVPNIDKIRFVNSGTEACMSAVRLARGYTGKDKIIKFAGCYHGHSDSFLIQAGSGAITFGSPNSPGVTQGTAKDTLLANYNDLESVRELIVANKGKIAAVIIEPIAGNMGCIIPQEEFIKGLRALCTEENILLIFDEVMTGFRLGKGGAQEALGIDADIAFDDIDELVRRFGEVANILLDAGLLVISTTNVIGLADHRQIETQIAPAPMFLVHVGSEAEGLPEGADVLIEPTMAPAKAVEVILAAFSQQHV